MIKKAHFFFILFFPFMLISQEIFNLVPEGSDYAIEINMEKILKVRKLAEIAESNPAYISFKAILQSGGLDFEKSINKILIAGSYRKKPSIIFDTKLTEKDFMALISEKKPETFNISGRKIYRYNENNKTIFASFIKNGKIIFSENPSIVTDFKTIDFERIVKANYPVSQQFIARGYFSEFEKALNLKSGQRQDKRSLLGNGIEEGYFEINSPDGIILENIAYFVVNQENKKLVEFQVNTLFILLTAKIASENQKFAHHLRDSFKITPQGNLFKVSFKIDSSFLYTSPNNFKKTNEDFFDPFAQ